MARRALPAVFYQRDTEQVARDLLGMILEHRIDGRQNRAQLYKGPLRITAGDPVPDSQVGQTPRIGISRARDWPLRWIVRRG